MSVIKGSRNRAKPSQLSYMQSDDIQIDKMNERRVRIVNRQCKGGVNITGKLVPT